MVSSRDRKVRGAVVLLALFAIAAILGWVASRLSPNQLAGTTASSSDVHLEWSEGTALSIDDGQIEIALNGDSSNTMTLRLGPKRQLVYYDDGIVVGSYVYLSYLNTTDDKGRHTVYTASLAPDGPAYPDSEVERKLQEQHDALPWRKEE